MPAAFTPISLDLMDDYLARYAACPQKTSDYSFANLYGWCEEYGLQWAFGDTHVWLRQTKPEVVHWAPVGPWTGVDWSLCPSLAQGVRVTRVPSELAGIWRESLGGRLSLEPAREHFDYVYAVAELIELKGNKWHKKKNLLAQFERTYAYEYAALCPELIEEALALQTQWSQWRDSEPAGTLSSENRAIFRVMQAWDELPGLFGGAIRVDGKMVAYTVAEVLDASCVVIHFEKGMPGYKGVYQAINQMFLANQAAGYTYVNREQDLGDDSLRKAKMSYNPAFLLEKFTATVEPDDRRA
jgi:hypothetical protein